MTVAQRLAGGYLSILGRLLRGVLALLVLALLAAAITLPLWALANGARTVYNAVFLLAGLSGGVTAFVLRRRGTVRQRRHGAPIILLGAIASLAIAVLGIVGRSLVLTILGLAGLSIPLAWSFGARR